MNKPFIEIDAEHFTVSAFETKPIEGYEAPTNKETGEQFPNCCPFHKSVFEGAESWFSKFPNCCDQHKAMVSKWWYNKANYSGIAEKIVKQLSYTEHHISERINIDDWYKDITDYIEYNVSSFGHPAIGLHLYLGNVQHYIKNTNSEIPKIKRQVLIEFIETYYNSPIDIDKTNKTDLNVLYSTYQKWLKVFPFEISFFSTLKPHFEKQLPILNGKPETNKYTGLAKVKMHTKSSLIDVLLNLTNNLLTQINTTTLYEKGLLTEPQKIKLELVLNERKMKLKQGYVNSSKDEEQRYRKILKEWFADEKRFIDEVTPIVKALPPQPIKTKADILKEQLSQYGFFELEKVKTLSEQSKVSIIEKIAESGLPYAIAMFDYLQFIPYLEKKHFGSKYKLNREVSKWFDSDKEGRAVKGNISSLLKNTTENKDRYTAYKHKENVIKDYEQLK
jgi:hypothetical protein